MNRGLLVLVSAIALTLASAAFAESKVLIIGDSHTCGEFGLGLLSVLDAQNDVKTALYASCGSSPEHWMGTPFSNKICSRSKDYDQKTPTDVSGSSRPVPALADLVREKKPGTVVIALGGNQMPREPGASLKKARENVVKAMRVAKSGGANCIWVGPPSRLDTLYPKENQDRFEAMLRSACQENGCRFVNSREFTNAKDTVNDKAMHIHYYPYPKSEGGRNPGKEWGRGVGGDILTSIRVNGPTGTLPVKTSAAEGKNAN